MRGITYDRKRVAQMATKYDGYVAKLFDKYIEQLAMYSYAVDPNKAFAFSQVMPKVQVDAIFKEFYNEMYAYMAESASNEWRLSNVKYDKITSSYLKGTELQGSHKLSKLRDTLYDRNQKGLNSFLKRKKYGKTLSNRVWNITNQFKRDTEVAMRDIVRVSITEGTSASKMATELKKHLKEPNRLYRRVRDKDGVLKWSKQAKAYNPGRGVYKSSYQNALRLARTEVNQAFRFADYNRVQSLDFVVGIEIIRSTTPYDCDICEELKGRYPKDYIFLGHHPNCRCVVKTILADKKEFDSYLKELAQGKDVKFKPSGKITKYPKAYYKYKKVYEKQLKAFKKM